MQFSQELMDGFGACAAAIGEPAFAARLCDAVSRIAPWRMRMVMVYSIWERPRYIYAPDVPQEQIELYLSGFYRLDPFFAHWRQAAEAGVFTMQGLHSVAGTDTAYFQVFQPQTGMRDGVAIFLPAQGQEALTVCLEHDRHYTPVEFNRLRRLFPLLEGLNASHQRFGASRGDSEAAGHDETNEEVALPPISFEAIFLSFLHGGLTPREREIVRFIIEGCSSSSIAERLELSEGTVKNHRKRLYKKLQITSERELLALFIRHLAGAP